MKNTKKQGGVLLMAMLVMLAFSVLAVGLYKLRDTDSVEAVYVEQSNQAFWIAESGLQRALDKLRTEKPFRDDPYSWSELIGNGSNDVQVTEDITTNDTWKIVSQGTVGSMVRIISLDPYLFAEVGYGLMGLDGDSRLNQFGSVDGNIYSFGTLTVNGRSTPSVTGEVNALDTRNLDYTPLSANDKVEMEINAPLTDFTAATGDPVSYIDIITTNGTVVATNTYVDLTGEKVVKIDEDYDFNNAAADGTYGDGTLIVDGDLTFRNSGNPFVIGDNGSVYVNGDIWAGKDGTFGENVDVYATGSMSLQKAAGSGGTTLRIEGDLTVNKELNFNGLIFAEGSVTVDGDLTLNGSLIAGEDFWLKAGYDVTYSGDEIPQEILDQMIVFVTYATTPGTWNEVSAFAP